MAESQLVEPTGVRRAIGWSRQARAYMFLIDGGFVQDPASGYCIAGGKYYWDPDPTDDPTPITDLTDNRLHCKYISYPLASHGVSRLKCVMWTCLHILQTHGGTSFVFVTDLAELVKRAMADGRPPLAASLRVKVALMDFVTFVECARLESNGWQLLQAGQQQKAQKRNRRRHQHATPPALPETQ